MMNGSSKAGSSSSESRQKTAPVLKSIDYNRVSMASYNNPHMPKQNPIGGWHLKNEKPTTAAAFSPYKTADMLSQTKTCQTPSWLTNSRACAVACFDACADAENKP